MSEVRTFTERENEDSATVSVQRNLMHLSGNCRYGDEYVPQKQGTNILYALNIL